MNRRTRNEIIHLRQGGTSCRRYRPQTKGKIERPFGFVDSNLLNARAAGL